MCVLFKKGILFLPLILNLPICGFKMYVNMKNHYSDPGKKKISILQHNENNKRQNLKRAK